ncbi:MAG TPA: hypothetical protein VEU11_02625 [Terriglobales bacterium]|nr:hypothetical protein [Terriglobales bacterium]
MIILVAVSATVSAQAPGDMALARELSDSRTRAKAVADIVASNGSTLPLLLVWAQAPPADVDQHELDIGLADVFGELKTKEAIPFLVGNIGLRRDHRVNVWLKTPGAIEKELPAAAALIRIGPEGAKAVIQAYWQPMLAEDRAAAIFVVTKTVEASPNAVPEARGFLQSALAHLRIDRLLAEEGLEGLDRKN